MNSSKFKRKGIDSQETRTFKKSNSILKTIKYYYKEMCFKKKPISPKDKYNTLQESDSIGLIKKKFENKDENVVSSSVLLTCPWSFEYISHPVRGRDCQHVECFDLQSFISSNPTKCPFCSSSISLEFLVADRFFEYALNECRIKNISKITIFKDYWSPQIDKITVNNTTRNSLFIDVEKFIFEEEQKKYEKIFTFIDENNLHYKGD